MFYSSFLTRFSGIEPVAEIIPEPLWWFEVWLRQQGYWPLDESPKGSPRQHQVEAETLVPAYIADQLQGIPYGETDLRQHARRLGKVATFRKLKT